MSYAVTNDNGTIHVRASVTSRAEMGELARALANAEKHLPEESPAFAEATAGKPANETTEEKPNG